MEHLWHEYGPNFNETQQPARPEVQKELKRRWRKSLWRILPLPIASYVCVGIYLWATNTPDAWYRAAAPVLAVLIFITFAPYVRNMWFRYMRKKIEARQMDVQ